MRPLRPSGAATLPLAVFLLSMAAMASMSADGAAPDLYSDQQQPLNPGDFTSPSTAAATTTPNTVPAFPVARANNQSSTCRLDLSDELFGGVDEACVRGGLDRSRCCPVLAAWLFAAHARSALELRPPATASDTAGMGPDEEVGPMMPDDNQRCVDSLQSALERRDIRLPRPNATCDTVLCFCGIRLHQIGSLQCPAAFNVTAVAVSGEGGGAARNATPTAAVRLLERDCRNASYAGCTRCLHSLDKVAIGGNHFCVQSDLEITLKLHNGGGTVKVGGDRMARMFGRDCQLMGLTWLLAKNKTAYIPTVSAVLRAILYSAHPPAGDVSNYKCSPDQENMPLAVDSLQFQHLEDSSSSRHALGFVLLLSSIVVLSIGPFASW